MELPVELILYLVGFLVGLHIILIWIVYETRDILKDIRLNIEDLVQRKNRE